MKNIKTFKYNKSNKVFKIIYKAGGTSTFLGSLAKKMYNYYLEV